MLGTVRHTWFMSEAAAPPLSGAGLGRGALTRAAVDAVSADLLGGMGTRLAHVRTAGRLAGRLSVLFGPDDAALLVAAAGLHDIGYAPQIAQTGFHPLDGALFLRGEGFPERLAALVAHHSLAHLTAPMHGVHDLHDQFPSEHSLLADALVWADMHSAPDGREIRAEERLADIAARHTHPHVALRANGLRLAMIRVGAALVAVGQRPRTIDLSDRHAASQQGARLKG